MKRTHVIKLLLTTEEIGRLTAAAAAVALPVASWGRMILLQTNPQEKVAPPKPTKPLTDTQQYAANAAYIKRLNNPQTPEDHAELAAYREKKQARETPLTQEQRENLDYMQLKSDIEYNTTREGKAAIMAGDLYNRVVIAQGAEHHKFFNQVIDSINGVVE